MDDEERLEEERKRFPFSQPVRLVLIPWLETRLADIESGWANANEITRNKSAIEKKSFERMMNELRLSVNVKITVKPDTSQTGGNP